MRSRTGLVLGVVAGYLVFVAYATTGAQCPLNKVGPCAKVHALFAGARAPVSPLVTAATPMRGRGGIVHEPEVQLRLAAAPARR